MDIYLSNPSENNENARAAVSKKVASGKPVEGRQTLSVLQPTQDARSLTRYEPAKQKKDKKGIVGQKKAFAIFEDPKSKSKPGKCACVDAGVQTESEACCHCTCHEDGQKDQVTEEDEAYRLLCQDEVPTDYWKQLAESRREALEESLHENEMLHSELKELRDENSRLSELAEHAEYFANILKTVADEDDGQKEEERANDNETNLTTNTTDSESETPPTTEQNLNLKTESRKPFGDSDSE